MGVTDCMNPLPMLKPEKSTSETSVLKAYSSNQQHQRHLEAYWNQHSLGFPISSGSKCPWTETSATTSPNKPCLLITHDSAWILLHEWETNNTY